MGVLTWQARHGANEEGNMGIIVTPRSYGAMMKESCSFRMWYLLENFVSAAAWSLDTPLLI